MRVFAIFLLLFAFLWLPADFVFAKSAYSPRQSGMEPPGGPRPLDVLPGNSPVRTPEGGMGYTDAYGNTLTDRVPDERKPQRRLRRGAYGEYKQAPEANLPDPPSRNAAPVWSFK